MKRSIEIALAAAIVLFLLVLLGPFIGVGISYPAPYENDPLTKPLKVASMTTNRITLMNGRTLLIDASLLMNPHCLENFDNRVELKETGIGSFEVYVKQRTLVCGTGRPTVIIPVIPERYPKYKRYLLGVGMVQK